MLLEILAIVGGFLGAWGLLAQTMRVYIRQSALDLSWAWIYSGIISGLIWVAYHSLIGVLAAIIWTCIGIVSLVLLAIAKYKWGRDKIHG